DTDSAKEQRVVVMDSVAAQAGNIVWSPDGSFFLLTVADDPCSANWTHSIFRVDLANTAVTPLVEEDPRQFTILEWPNPEQAEVRLQDKDGNIWRLDVNSGELAQEK
ncbi:MAG: hypothetical protein IAF02_11565, partial [Anaerolineae bacterium]|nr:hypothetical protein [Anaerolineae bacterium]